MCGTRNDSKDAWFSVLQGQVRVTLVSGNKRKRVIVDKKWFWLLSLCEPYKCDRGKLQHVL